MLSEGTRPLPRCSDLGGGPLSRTEVKGPSPRRLLYWEEVHISRGHTAYAQHCTIALDLHLLINDISCVDVHSRIERSKKKKKFPFNHYAAQPSIGSQNARPMMVVARQIL